ncbi:hypothetical protein LLH00_17510 [bacterium]|nr:hypothetical protein [bacterium]
MFLLVALALYLAAMFGGRLWVYGGVPALDHPFGDMLAVLAAVDGSRAGYDVQRANPLDPYGRPHVYSRVWLWLRYTGLTERFNTAASVVIVALFLACAVLLLRPRGPGELILAAAVLLSPAVMLGVERANNDLIVFSLLTASVLLLSGKLQSRLWLGVGLIFLASCLKYYPAAAYTALVRAEREKRPFWLKIAVIVAGLALFLWWSRADIALIRARDFLQPLGRYTFGSLLLFCRLGLAPAVSGISIAALSVAAWMTALGFSARSEAALRGCGSIDGLFFLCGVSVLAFCFFSTTNYDYRCIYFIPTMPLLMERHGSPETSPSFRLILRLLLAAIMIVLWSEFGVATVRLVGKVAHQEAARDALVEAIAILEQVCTWFSLVVLLSLGFGLLREPLHRAVRGLLATPGTKPG